jgi:hypothetical protein
MRLNVHGDQLTLQQLKENLVACFEDHASTGCTSHPACAVQVMQKRPITTSNPACAVPVMPGESECQKRPITVSKETYYNVKRHGEEVAGRGESVSVEREREREREETDREREREREREKGFY